MKYYGGILVRLAVILLVITGACLAVFAEGTSGGSEAGAAAVEACVEPVHAMLAAGLMVMTGLGIFIWRNGFKH